VKKQYITLHYIQIYNAQANLERCDGARMITHSRITSCDRCKSLWNKM